MKLSQIKGVDAVDAIADILEPVAVIFADEEIQKAIEAKKPYIIITQIILKRHKEAILEVLAVLNGADPKTFKPSLIELPIMLMQLVQEIAENKELADLFHLQEQMTASVSSIPATPTTEGTETM